MKSRVILAAVLLGLLLVQALLAAEKEFGGGGIVYGKGYAFLIEAPAGWVLDTRSGVPDGLQAVFYPRGSSWSKSPTVMYAAWASKKTSFAGDTLANQTLRILSVPALEHHGAAV